MSDKHRLILQFIRDFYQEIGRIPLHAPLFIGNEKKYVSDAIDSTFVSSVGEYVNRFERLMCEITGAKYAIAIVNGTNALHLALILAGVKRDDEVLSQSLTFIATCNAISYIGARPLFVDIDSDSLGMSPSALEAFLSVNCKKGEDGFSYNVVSGRRIKACVPMHTFGNPARVEQLRDICKRFNIKMIEDSAESIGSFFNGVHTGRYGDMGVFSFNGNKTVTSGGGGAIITDDEELAELAKHLSTQAKVPHRWEFVHDSIGYNYRMPNLNAALLCAQLEQLDFFIERKRHLAHLYEQFFKEIAIPFVSEIPLARSNYWLNSILFSSSSERDEFLLYSNEEGVMTRPVWKPMHTLPMFSHMQKAPLSNTEFIAERLVNLPSSVKL